MPEREILYEMLQIGNTIKVTAIDSLTGTEATIVGPASAPASLLRQNAGRKLEFLLTRKKG